MMAEIPAEVPVCRAPFKSSVSARWARRIRDLFGLYSPFARQWQSAILQIGAHACQVHRPELIYVSMSPFESAWAAAALAKKFRLPWVADLRDPWALDEMQVHITGLHRRLEAVRMRRSLQTAAVVIMNTPEAARRLLEAFPEFRQKRVVVITNGYDGEDFSSVIRTPDATKFNIVHAGYLHSEAGFELQGKRFFHEAIGKVMRGVDFLTRSHYFLLQALERWLASDSRLKEQVRLTLAGSLTAEDARLARNSPVSEIVECTGYLSHRETVQRLVNSDLLFLPMHNLPPGRRATIVPGKTYEYMASGRPILAAVPEGDARDFVIQANTGLVCPPDDVGGMVQILRRQYADWQAGKQTTAWNRSFVAQFERLKLTQTLAEELDRVLAFPAVRVA